MRSTNQNKQQLKRASNAALASLLNLTFLPVISFFILVFIYKKTQRGTIDHYHARLGLKINIIAATALILVSILVILVSGFNSAWTWVFVITYFVIVHAGFIVFAVWALVRAWSGDQLKNSSHIFNT